MTNPSELKYARSDEWAKGDGEIVTVGITDYAQHELGEIVFVELPDVGANIVSGAAFGVVESVKAVSELVSPISGEVVEVNAPLIDNPATINESAFDRGWLIKIKATDRAPLDALMNSEEYSAYRA